MNLTILKSELSKITEDVKENLGYFINNHNEIIIIGNGGSNSISSSTELVYWDKASIAPNPSLGIKLSVSPHIT